MKGYGKYITGGIAVLAVALMTIVAGCLGGNEDDEKVLNIAGSTTVQPVAQAAASAYMKDHSDVEIFVSGGGSSVGVTSAVDGTADIGMASRELKDSEKTANPGIVVTVIAKDGIALIVHPDNNVTGLTKDQVAAIYKGEITNWKDVGGPDQTIVLVGRDSASGTRASFEELLDIDGSELSTGMLEQQSNGGIFEYVKGNPNAIGYVGLGYVKEGVMGVPINGVQPTIPNVQSGTYPISRSLNMVTMGAPDGLAKEFLDFILSPQGQTIVENSGFVPLS